MEQHDLAVPGEMTVGLDVGRASALRRGNRCVGVLRNRFVNRQPPVRKDARVWRVDEVRVGHACSSGADFAASRAPNAPDTPLSASVNSLGMIQSLLDALSLIFGSVCRYW